MRISIRVLSVCVSGASLTLASYLPFHLRLSARQDVQIPDQCVAGCGDVPNRIGANDNCTTEVCCTETFFNQFVTCFTCIGDYLNDTDFSAAQGLLNTLQSQCAAAGTSIAPVSFSSTASGSATGSTGSVSALTTSGSVSTTSASQTTTTSRSSTHTSASSTSESSSGSASAPSSSSTGQPDGALGLDARTALMVAFAAALGALAI